MEFEQRSTPLNIGRPDIYDEKSRRFWKKVHDLIKEWPDIETNGVFEYIDGILLDDTRHYIGGGYKY